MLQEDPNTKQKKRWWDYLTGNGKKAKEQVDLERVSAMFKNDIKTEIMADLTGGTG